MIVFFFLILILILLVDSINSLKMSSSSSSLSPSLIPIPSSIKLILWDVDGTLSDSFQLGYSSTKVVLNNNGIKDITEEEYHLGTKYTTPRRLAWHVTGNPDDPIGILLGTQFDELYVKLVSTKTAGLYPGVLDMLDKILDKNRNIKYGALSNAAGAYVRAVCNVNNLNSKFIVKYGADDVPEAKPSPLGLINICKEFQYSIDETIYIGDSPSDGMAATSCGMYSIGVTYGSHPITTVKPNFSTTVTTVNELQSLLLSMV